MLHKHWWDLQSSRKRNRPEMLADSLGGSLPCKYTTQLLGNSHITAGCICIRENRSLLDANFAKPLRNVLPRLRDAKIDDVGRDDMQRMHKLLRARSLSPKNMSGVRCWNLSLGSAMYDGGFVCCQCERGNPNPPPPGCYKPSPYEKDAKICLALSSLTSLFVQVLKILEAFISVMPPLEISHDNPYAHEAEEAMLFGQKEVQELLRSCFGNPACPAPG